MATWSVVEVNGMPCRLDPYINKDTMFDDMRQRVGLDGLFRCKSGAADYVYRITRYGYQRIAGKTPIDRRRTGRGS